MSRVPPPKTISRPLEGLPAILGVLEKVDGRGLPAETVERIMALAGKAAQGDAAAYQVVAAIKVMFDDDREPTEKELKKLEAKA